MTRTVVSLRSSSHNGRELATISRVHDLREQDS